ncbi:hypothetical protein GCM10011611_13340 [Aliidongia dinghuensis]|uniref:PepSY domain-containing protein n=1 Tax=Aliidongia dinghuensis TaxID=1867774 RepID=A0A8J3E2K0_9PROT|nr:hypothetical protein [Aliidongia dinghuensis]GGF09150.1 hypothetical protein GCM10011611_13340 [Aliidongia dinghuensis]
MRILMAASAALALIASGAAFAAPSNSAAAPSAPQQAQPTAPHKVAMRHHGRDVIGDRETAALNSLEASGYYTFKDIRPDGKNIAADAQKPGAGFVHLMVTPDGAIKTASGSAT